MHRLLCPALIASVFLIAACEEAIGPSSNEAGSYELVSVNGRAPPAPFFSVELLSASVVLNPNRTYETESRVRGKDNLGQTVTQTYRESGSYTRTDNTLRLTSTSGGVTIGIYGGRTITVDADSAVIVYRRYRD